MGEDFKEEMNKSFTERQELYYIIKHMNEMNKVNTPAEALRMGIEAF